MTNYLFFALVISVFYSGIATGLLTSRRGDVIRGTRITAVGICLVALAWQGLRPTSAYIFPIVFLAGVTSILVLLVGVGGILGSLLARLAHKRRLQLGLLAFIVICTAAVGGIFTHSVESKKSAEKHAKLAAQQAFQRKTLAGQLGPHSVSFPVHPFLTIHHLCRHQSRECITSWGSAGLNGVNEQQLFLTALRFSFKQRREKTLVEWCVDNPALASTPWCTIREQHSVILHLKESLRIPIEDAGRALLFDIPEPFRTLACFDEFAGMRCIAVLDIAPEIEARLQFRGLTPSSATRSALDQLPFVQGWWRSLTQRD